MAVSYRRPQNCNRVLTIGFGFRISENGVVSMRAGSALVGCPISRHAMLAEPVHAARRIADALCRRSKL
jgi:hypothetical protein